MWRTWQLMKLGISCYNFDIVKTCVPVVQLCKERVYMNKEALLLKTYKNRTTWVLSNAFWSNKSTSCFSMPDAESWLTWPHRRVKGQPFTLMTFWSIQGHFKSSLSMLIHVEKLKPSKCLFVQKEVNYLGHDIIFTKM